ncbi:hypothetical protein LDX50_01100 [Fulvivirga sp. 1062]|uniref:pyruvate kinase n=2 Tax=Fulvivirga sedimenti TaxID=2879465 RepID=A0A9X1KUF3_9BACT|nr:hypothetical protein [Fulvivirga sedimenti]
MKKEQVIRLRTEIEKLRKKVIRKQQDASGWIEKVHPEYTKGAINLTHYIALRSNNLVPIQKKLGYLGITRFARSQSHVMDSLLRSEQLLSALAEVPYEREKAVVTAKQADKLIKRHSNALLGKKPATRRVRIMVTLPTEAALDPMIADELVKRGMDCARINCAHDGPAAWLSMIKNVKSAGRKYAREVKIAMDLGGPKIRTGPILPGPEVRHLTPERDGFGRVISPARILFTPKLDSNSPAYAIPVDKSWLQQLLPGDRIHLVDTREREAIMEIAEITDEGVLAHCYTSVYIGTETILKPEREDLTPCRILYLPPKEQSLLLHPGDRLVIHQSALFGEPDLFDESGHLLQEAHMSCTFPEIFRIVEKGERIFFDDGKIGGVIEKVANGYIEVKIDRASKSGTKLRADKGINLPDIKKPITGLTEKDREDLKFVVKHADIVNVSFVNNVHDVEEFITLLKSLNAGSTLGVTMKIETQEAFNNLPHILMAVMRIHPVGIMIARGDLAIEVGWDEIGRIQQEILGICSSAHIPVIWATQVLESLAKKGLPSRSEITDATHGLKAECVMLNKGPYTHRAVSLLDKIFSSMEEYQSGNEALFPQLKKAINSQ